MEQPVEFPSMPSGDDKDDESKKLAKKNFELARALAAAQRKMAEQEEALTQERQNREKWVQNVQEDLAFVAEQLVEVSEAELDKTAPRTPDTPRRDLKKGDISGAIRRAGEIREHLKKMKPPDPPSS